MIIRNTILKSLPIGIIIILLMSTFSTVTGNDIFINPWQLKAPNQPYEDHNATVGDTITFFWSPDENHTVYINPSGNCDDSGSIIVGSDNPASYTFLESDTKNSSDGKPIFFADNIAKLCEWGMRFVVNVKSDGINESTTAFMSSSTDDTTETPTSAPTIIFTSTPSQTPTDLATTKPSFAPSHVPTQYPSDTPIVITGTPSINPSATPSVSSTNSPSLQPTVKNTTAPSNGPTNRPTTDPTLAPTNAPTNAPTQGPTEKPSNAPTNTPTSNPTRTPTAAPVLTGSPVTPSAPPTNNPTEAPILSTLAPTAKPTIEPTDKPYVQPTYNPTDNPTDKRTAPPTPVAAVVTDTPTRAPNEKTTISPTAVLRTQEPTNKSNTGTDTPNENTLVPVTSSEIGGEEMISQTLTGLQMGMAGVTDLPISARASWEELTQSFCDSYVFNDLKNSVSYFDTTYEVTDVIPITLQRHQRMMRGNQRGLQSQQGIIVEYTQTVKYDTIDPKKFTPNLMVTAPFETDKERTAYVTLLGTSLDDTLSLVTGVSEIQIRDVSLTLPPESSTDAPNKAPKGAPLLTKPAIIGISCGVAAALVLIVIFGVYCCRSGGGSEGGGDVKSSGEPPLHVSVKDDEVSTLAGPQTGPPTYGDQSVATMDYDYSKAYGGAGDTSVSSAGGTFGSNTQNITLPANTAATGAALGALNMDDNTSYDAQYNEPRANTKEEVMHIFAPPGKLGVVIDTPDDGAPIVHAVKDSSVIADRIIVGDKLVAVDDEDVRSMTAIKVSKMISRKGANPSRKLTIIRTAPIEE